jgi:hypothetical protein
MLHITRDYSVIQAVERERKFEEPNEILKWWREVRDYFDIFFFRGCDDTTPNSCIRTLWKFMERRRHAIMKMKYFC